MKGVSSVIAIILILMIVVALAALAYTWFTGIFATLTATTATAVTTTTAGMQAQFIIESAKYSGGNVKFIIRNTGSTTIDVSKVSAYVSDTRLGGTFSGTLNPGDRSAEQTGTGAACTCSGGYCTGGSIFKVTTETGLEQRSMINC